jgi:hypothetical protein
MNLSRSISLALPVVCALFSASVGCGDDERASRAELPSARAAESEGVRLEGAAAPVATVAPTPSSPAAGLSIDGIACTVTAESVRPIAAPGNQWTFDLDAECGASLGKVSVFLKARRDASYPIACGDWTQVSVVLDDGSRDGGTTVWSRHAGDVCEITSGPTEDAPGRSVAFTAKVAGAGGDPVHRIAYHAPSSR